MHKAFGVYLHITWHTYRRHRIINRGAAEQILATLEDASRRWLVHVHEKAVLSDHVHVIASIRPDSTISSFVRHAKSESARRVNNSAASLQWARGYFVESLSRTHVSRACAYVARQFRRHPDRVPC